MGRSGTKVCHCEEKSLTVMFTHIANHRNEKSSSGKPLTLKHTKKKNNLGGELAGGGVWVRR